MGEAKRRRESAVQETVKTIVETPGGRIQVCWDGKSAGTPFGQMAFFIEFLMLTGLYAKWVETCPLAYQGPHSSKISDLLGTLFLSVLSGHKRYAHITTLRADGVMPELLGMLNTVSEDTVRRGLMAIEEDAGRTWLQSHLDHAAWPLLSVPWILDVDVTVKPLYGHQEGAVLGYNPKKPGRPSHTYHTYQMAGLRLVLGVEVEAGNQSHSNKSLPGLLELIDRLPSEKRPTCVRGDCGFGNDNIMSGLEQRGLPYLFKLKLTQNVKRYLENIFWSEGWQNAGQGWEGREGEIKLMGWYKNRRIIALRRPLIGHVLLADESQQLGLAFLETEGPIKQYEYIVLVTDLLYDVPALSQLYRDRADSENTFDELKNQWGWGGYTTQDIKRSRFAAMTVALIYNWWSLFVRLAKPEARLEAITSRPFLLSGIARKTTHAGQQHLKITPLHGKGEQAKTMLIQVSRLLHEWKKIAEQLISTTVWRLACQYIIAAVTGFNCLGPPQKTG